MELWYTFDTSSPAKMMRSATCLRPLGVVIGAGKLFSGSTFFWLRDLAISSPPL